MSEKTILDLYAEYMPLINPEISDSGFVVCNCPFHDDRHASAGISITTGVFNCYRCGSFSPAHFIAEIAKVPIEEARQILEEYRITNDLVEKFDTFVKRAPRPTVRFDALYKKSQELMSPDLEIVRDYMERCGFTYETLQAMYIGYLPAEETSWGRESLVFPYLLEGRAVAIRYRDMLGNKGGEPACHFTLWNIDALEGEHDVVILQEGETDGCTAFQAVEGRFPVVSTPTATFQKEWAREFDTVRQVIMIPQDDDASTKMIEKARIALGPKLTVIQLPWKKREWGKDTNNWVGHRSYKDLANLIDAHVTPLFQRIMWGREMSIVAQEEQQWLIKGLIARRQAAVIAGQPKSMKTWLVLNMVRCLLEPGSHFCGIPELESAHGVNNILFIEEEGNLEELNSRAERVLDGTDWKNRTVWMHHLGVRLDIQDWGTKLEKIVKDYDIDLMVIDPFQRTHTADENDASAIGVVWGTLDRLLAIYPHLAIVVLHHFRKTGDISDTWNAFRGSSRIAAEADLGIFVEKRAKSEATGIRVKFDGRSIPDITTADGKDVFKLAFDEGIFCLDSGRTLMSNHQALVEEIREREKWTLKEAAQHFGVSVDTVRNWAKKCGQQIAMESPAPGRPAALVIKEDAE